MDTFDLLPPMTLATKIRRRLSALERVLNRRNPYSHPSYGRAYDTSLKIGGKFVSLTRLGVTTELFEVGFDYTELSVYSVYVKPSDEPLATSQFMVFGANTPSEVLSILNQYWPSALCRPA